MDERAALLGLTIACLVAAPARAHHGWGAYDTHELVSLSGTIAEASYEYPHGTIHLKAGDKTWRVVLAPPFRMDSRGLTRPMLEPGETVSVEGYPHKTDANEFRAERITIGGKTTELR